MLQLKSKDINGNCITYYPKTVFLLSVEIVDNIFKLAKTRPNISFFTFSCIKTVFDVLNKGRDIPEHSIKRIYILKIFDAP